MRPLFFCLLLALRRVAADDGEESDSNPRCNTDVNIASQADADSIASCHTVRGSVTMTSSASGAVNLHGVETIQGPLTARGASNLSSLIASDLKTITGTLTVANNDALNQISMSNLQTVGGDIKVENNRNLKDLSLSDLDEVRGGLTVSGDFNRNKSSGSDGLSTGAKAGIAVAVVIVVLLILFFLWLFIRRRKRQQNRRTEKTLTEAATSPIPAPTGLATNTEKLTSKLTPPQEDVERSIPRKPLSPPPAADARSSVPASLLPGSERMSVPVSLLPGSDPSVSSASASHQRVTSDPSLFLHHIPPAAPRPPPSEMDVPMLDSGNVYEVGTGRTRPQSPIYELDGGGMSNHQQPIHRE
ncbi:putative GPI-anchored cell wall protein Pst1 [Aspergillus fischeri NRRL 181]|uniref:GPI-anchored cell wall protein Pst1, putative n=1 Tax=Neosartorya fischeri (strain ATCC 1020 / DSM 3700 / CBS 544.65 / FGSC A1164 / JCM 1740 / NRRL 181 / WB 181) TaxID=331117 RepID=A1DN87_NEOFI|nr:GPI-anchored cell wall protein Pst1, putative [Aspergillus fischeri NRRL 181]EAW16258.1 GPI-anchored cell wall protein Pst1, putative [Aspergillus fischeri NRRL 181]